MRSLFARSGFPSYGPRRNFVSDEKILFLRKLVDLVEYNIPRKNHITLRRSALDSFCITLFGPWRKKFGDSWARSFRVNHINLSRKAEKQGKF